MGIPIGRIVNDQDRTWDDEYDGDEQYPRDEGIVPFEDYDAYTDADLEALLFGDADLPF